jgi:hypothetical protein
MKDYAGMSLHFSKTMFVCPFLLLTLHVGVSPMMLMIPLDFNA